MCQFCLPAVDQLLLCMCDSCGLKIVGFTCLSASPASARLCPPHPNTPQTCNSSNNLGLTEGFVNISKCFFVKCPILCSLQATGKNFIMDSKFNLGNLLELGLHNYVDACSEIVDRAQKELIIEKALKKIDETWSSLSLTFSPYQDTDNVQMTVEDSITEALETDNLALQTMSGGKYVQVSMHYLWQSGHRPARVHNKKIWSFQHSHQSQDAQSSACHLSTRAEDANLTVLLKTLTLVIFQLAM